MKWERNRDLKGLTLGALAGIGAGELVCLVVGAATGLDIPIGAEMAVDAAGAVGLGAYGYQAGQDHMARQRVMDHVGLYLFDPEGGKPGYEEFIEKPPEETAAIAERLGQPLRPENFTDMIRRRKSAPDEGHER